MLSNKTFKNIHFNIFFPFSIILLSYIKTDLYVRGSNVICYKKSSGNHFLIFAANSVIKKKSGDTISPDLNLFLLFFN
jgi:hypothetical protein